jgi:hypothetical protein
MYFSIFSVFVLLLSIFSVVASPVASDSNAQRLARGLSPRAPKFSRMIPGVAPPLVENVSRVSSAKRGVTSPTPDKTYTGKLQVRYTDGTVAGFVRNWSGGGTISGIAFVDAPLEVKFTVSGPGPFDILATNPAFPAPYYVGASGSQTQNYGKESTLGFTNVAQTPAGARPTNGYESAIWSFDPQSKKLSAKWVNPDGSSVNANLVYSVRENSLFFAGDIPTWMQQHPNYFISAVNLYLADN